MTFVSSRTGRGLIESAIPDENIPESSFGETFGASVGLVIDEELSISSTLNREGWSERKKRIAQKIDEGAIDRNKFRHPRKGFDYNAAAEFLQDPNIKTDTVLNQERNDMLARRRAYSQGVTERGGGVATFLGAATGYMLDPINLATMPIAFPTTAAKSLSILGRAMLTARNTAVIEAATELAIQPFVYGHKQDIESPYSFRDAVNNIAFAAGGGAALGFAGGGISGYLRKVLEKTASLTGEEHVVAKSYLERMVQTLDDAPGGREINLEQIKADLFVEAKRDLTKQLDEAATEQDKKNIQAQLDEIENGVLPESIQSKLDEAASQKIQAEKNFLIELEEQRVISNEPSKKPEHYVENRQAQIDAAKEAKMAAPQEGAAIAQPTERMRAVLESQGLAEEYDLAMHELSKIKNPVVFDGEDLVEYGQYVKSLDEEIDGIESVLRCVRGE